MDTNRKTTEPEDTKIHVRFKLSAFWTALMFLYIYADILSLFRPGQIEEMAAGRMGPFPVTQGSLLSASILMVIPAVMVFLCLTLKPRVARWANIILGVLYALVNIANQIGEPWMYYMLYGVVEFALTLLIVWYAVKWRTPEGQS